MARFKPFTSLLPQLSKNTVSSHFFSSCFKPYKIGTSCFNGIRSFATNSIDTLQSSESESTVVLKNSSSELMSDGQHSRKDYLGLQRVDGLGVYPPTQGGPVYWSLRHGWTNMKRKVRRVNRNFDFNWELGRTTFAGVPKFSYNPKANEWIYLIDNEEWNGVGGRVWIAISMHILYFFHWAFWAYFLYFRILVNGKLDAFTKWKDRVAETKAEAV